LINGRLDPTIGSRNGHKFSNLPGEEVAQTKFLYLTGFMKFIDLSQGVFERDVFIASVGPMEIEYANLVRAQSLERCLE